MKKMIIAIAASLALGTLLGWGLGSGRGHATEEHAEHPGEEQEEGAKGAESHAGGHDGEGAEEAEHGDHGGHAKESGEDGHEGESGVEPGDIADSMLIQVGIALDTAREGIIAEVIPLPGSVGYDPSRSSKVAARFAGLLRTLKVRVGDRVSQGDLLATVESDATLEPYEVRAARGGMVIHLDASIGQAVVAGQVLAEVVDLDVVVLDLKAGARDLSRIRVGQEVAVRVEGAEKGDTEIRSKVHAILPGMDPATQTRRVRLMVANPRRQFSEGQFVEGFVEVKKVSVKVLVPRASVQSSKGRDVVYVREGGQFEERVVVLGRKDARFVEVVTGLRAGETIASQGSFLVKADLGKSEAEHEH